jgi:phosphoglycolate phosphatase
MIRTILLDFDGTLVDSLAVALQCGNRVAKEMGYPPLKDSAALRNKTGREILKGYGISIFRLPAFVLKVKTYMNKESAAVKVFPDWLPVLAALHGRVTLGVVTSNSPDLVKRVLARESVVIDFFVCNTSIFGKHRTLKKLVHDRRLAAGEVVYIGDEVRDIAAGKAAGIPVIAVTWGYNSKKALAAIEPLALLDSPRDLPALLDRLNGGS